MRTRLTVAILFLALVAAALAAPSSAAGPASIEAAGPTWRQPHLNAAHDGFNRKETVLSPSTVAGLTTRWIGHAPSLTLMGAVLVTNDSVYAAGADNTGGDPRTALIRFDRSTGRRRWSVQQPYGSTTSGIAFGGGRVFMSTADSYLRAYDGMTGDLVWSFPAGGYVGAPTIVGDVLYLQTLFAGVFAVDAASGEPIWGFDYGDEAGSGPAVFGNRLFVNGGYDRRVQAVTADTGALVWTTPVDGDVLGSPAVDSTAVFVGVVKGITGTGIVYALDRADGHVLWQVPTPAGGVSSTPAIANGVLYVGDNGGDLTAFDETTGATLWTAHTRRAFALSSPIVANGVVYAATIGAYAFDAATGALLWSSKTDLVNMAPSLIEGVLYVGDFSGKVRAYSLP